jgi:transcriptional regulator with XRE-family HTH domain
MALAAQFARNLKKARLAQKLSQNGLAYRARISVSYISMLEREERSPPLGTIELLASALAVKPLDLLRG